VGFDSFLPSDFANTLPLGWEEQVLMPDYDEVIAAMAAGRSAVPDHNYSNRKRVLVVDDDLTARLYLRAKLSLIVGIDVYEASSGDEALKISEFTVFDGVLLDVDMGDKNGYYVCRAIKRQSQAHGVKPPKIYMITSRTSVIDRMRAKLAGADAFMSKPPYPSQLSDLLASL
jgi:DNA-binding response OmpR family regulator